MVGSVLVAGCVTGYCNLVIFSSGKSNNSQVFLEPDSHIGTSIIHVFTLVLCIQYTRTMIYTVELSKPGSKPLSVTVRCLLHFDDMFSI